MIGVPVKFDHPDHVRCEEDFTVREVDGEICCTTHPETLKSVFLDLVLEGAAADAQ
jgi:hypothetical protein